MSKRQWLLTLLVAVLITFGYSQTLPTGAIALSGTVYAPPGEDIAGTAVVACFVQGEDCDEAKSQVLEITTSGPSAPFNLSGLTREPYMLFASKDVNGNGVHFEDGDFYVLYGSDGNITPPALGLELRLEVLGAAPAAPGAESTSAGSDLYSVTGLVTDTQGRPIEGAKVWIQPALTTGLVETRTGPDGRYLASSLINVPYNAKAWTEVTYNGQRFCLRLGMPNASDYDSFVPEHGIERNFQWQLTGTIEDLRDFDGYFGGQVRIMNTGYYLDTAEAVEFTFAPTGPLIDGSTGTAFTRTLELSPTSSDLFDIPVGRYHVTAVLLGKDGSRKPLPIGPDIFDNEHDAWDLDWNSSGGCDNGSGVAWNYLWLDNPYE